MKITKKNLKAILMEEVESILQERESDSVYTELISHFMASCITGKVLELKPEVIDDKVAIAQSIEGIEKVFPNPESIRGLFETKVNIVYDKSELIT